MVAVPRHPTGRALALDDQDGADPGRSQFPGGGEAGRSGPHDHDGGTRHPGTRVSVPGSVPVSAATSATTSAPQ